MLARIFQRTAKRAQGELEPAVFSTALTDEDIYLTPAARACMAALMETADEEISAIRVFVTGGGCHGMTYGMTYTETVLPDDAVLATDRYRIAVDAIALSYLRGCTIDYVKQQANESFVFKSVFQSVGGAGTCGSCRHAGGSRY